ncbi:MAG: PD-(D/E)XK nuclease family protein [Muribaculaceae bacterium]|nr:PD-(D/E)XK nuclease family protein [Muribaculaceae bacterium]
MEWFTAPIHPLPGRFRFQLAEAIARSGGYLNQTCREITDKYISGEYAYPDERDKELSDAELKELEAKRRVERREMVRLFVPYLQPGYRTEENAEHTLNHLSVWARKRLHTLREDDDREAVATQLKALADSIDILMLLFSERDEKFDLQLAEEWVRDIPTEITLPQHPARVGSVYTVSRPWEIAATAPCIVWTNLESDDTPAFECEFLLPTERTAIEADARFWQREQETRFRYLNSIMPMLFATERMVLTCAAKRGGELIVPHPILTRLRVQIENFSEFISHDDISARRTVPVPSVDNASFASEHHFKHYERIQLPKRMSATGLETFTLYPFDFLFERILNYQTAGLSSLPELHTTRGNVAHATIARLFTPASEASGSDAAEIRERVEKGYEVAFQDAVNECGAIFRLPENKLEMNNLHYQLRNCIDSLIDIIEANRLTVEGCERHYSKFIDLHGNKPTEEPEEDLHGYVDLKLTDSYGSHVVFDLKWTRSRSFHQRLLETNRSTQLAVYSKLLGETGAPVITAYFVMPRGRLISCHPFHGRGVVKVDRINDADIMQQLVNSFRYRSRQLLSGVVENGEGHPLSDLAYGRDCEEFSLFPLSADDDVKGENIFSNYRLFKGF